LLSGPSQGRPTLTTLEGHGDLDMHTAPRPRSLRDLASLYLDHARTYYRRRNGDPTREHLNMRTSIERFLSFAGDGRMDASKVTRHLVRAWLDQLIAEDLSRSYINATLARVRRWLRWCVELDFAGDHVIAELALVRSLPAHRSKAREAPPRVPAVLADVLHVLPFMPRVPRDVCQLLVLTGARLGEILLATNADVDLEHQLIRPAIHKSAHLGKTRTIPLSAPAIAIVQRHHRYFCPADALFASPRSGTSYNPGSIRAAIRRACQRADVPVFTPHQVRHAVARQVREVSGLDAAQALLGHSSRSMTEHYAPVSADRSAQAVQALAIDLGWASRSSMTSNASEGQEVRRA
jgi:integrase